MIDDVNGRDLEKDAWELHRAVAELVRIYQFRDRKSIFYYDVSANQCYAIAAVMKSGVMNQSELSRRLVLDKSTTSRLVNSLVLKGYLARATNAKDARSVIIRVTGKGEELHRQIERDLMMRMKQLVCDFDPEVRHATARLLSKLARSAQERFQPSGQ